MKKRIFSSRPILGVLTLVAVLLCGTFHASAQVTVSQSFIDDANAAFREVVTLRTANTALLKANDALDKANTTNASAVQALLFSNDQLKEQNADLRELKCDSTSFVFGLVKIKRCK